MFIKLFMLACLILISNKGITQQATQLPKAVPPKVAHAEPLYIDLIRDLGARKGEKEWNVGLGLTDKQDFTEYELLVEYEWAPINRLGLEIEVPFSLYYQEKNATTTSPSNRIEGIKTAAQWSFFVNPKIRTSMALGYLNEIQFTDLNAMKVNSVFRGNEFNPFFIAAKRIGGNFHSLLYTGPRLFYEFKTSNWHKEFDSNISFHYMIPNTRNFVGLEFNNTWAEADFDLTIRPQMRVSLTDHLLVGIVTGIPISRENQRLSTFLRLIYEPPAKKR